LCNNNNYISRILKEYFNNFLIYYFIAFLQHIYGGILENTKIYAFHKGSRAFNPYNYWPYVVITHHTHICMNIHSYKYNQTDHCCNKKVFLKYKL